jgi:hypothetical protein
MTRAFLIGLWLLAAASSASAQVDLSGEWAPRFWEDQPERVPGPELGDYLGIPISEAARFRADTWSASIMTLPEWQCRPHSADYIWRGPSPLTITKDIDPVSREVVAFNLEWLRSVRRPIYLDGRPHPGTNAPHTWAGFSTATWRGDVLVVTTTHLKEGYLRRNGLPRSDAATLTEYFIRNDDILTVVTMIHDPVYLTETFVRTTDYELDLRQRVPPYPCHVVEEIDRPRGAIPHQWPASAVSSEEYAKAHHLPVTAVRGGAQTMYPRPMEGLAFAKADAATAVTPERPVDLTGQWMSVVTEDWRWRMVTPPVGDVSSVPLNAAGRAQAGQWSAAADEAGGQACRAYGAGGVMRLPGQIRFSWTDDNQLQLETEAGTQTRRLLFGSAGSAASPSLQGTSTAQWIRPGRPTRGAAPAMGGQLRVVTTQMTPGYLRKNGVPYSAQARLTEYFNRVDDPETGESWLVVIQVVDDPTYLNQRFFTSSHFKKVTDSTPWQPSACTAR